jgi:hypothetical protein
MVFLGDRGALKGSPRISTGIRGKPPSTHPHPLAKEKRSPRNSRPTRIGDPPGMVRTHDRPIFDQLAHFIDRQRPEDRMLLEAPYLGTVHAKENALFWGHVV